MQVHTCKWGEREEGLVQLISSAGPFVASDGALSSSGSFILVRGQTMQMALCLPCSLWTRLWL